MWHVWGSGMPSSARGLLDENNSLQVETIKGGSKKFKVFYPIIILQYNQLCKKVKIKFQAGKNELFLLQRRIELSLIQSFVHHVTWLHVYVKIILHFSRLLRTNRLLL